MQRIFGVAHKNEGKSIPVESHRANPDCLSSLMKTGALRVTWPRRSVCCAVRGLVKNEALSAAPKTEANHLMVDRNIAEWLSSNRIDARHPCVLVIT